MGLIGGIAGGMASMAGSLIAGGKLAQNLKDLQAQKAEINEQKAFSKSVMEKGMFQGAGQRADFQANQTAMLNALRQGNKEANQDITQGKSQAAIAAAKGRATEAVGQMASAEATQNANRRDQAYTTGQQNIQAWQQQSNQMQQYINEARSAQAANIQQAAGGLAQAANSLPF